MPRHRRLVVPGYVHHLTQRGVRRQRTFFCDEDYRRYLNLVREHCPPNGVEVLTHTLMPNHIHLAAIPESKDSLAHAMKEVNQRYTRRINIRTGWSGSLWQGRFWSTPFDWSDVPTLIRYILMNPVRGNVASRVLDWPYSSARVALLGEQDGIVNPARLAELLSGCELDLEEDLAVSVRERIGKATRGGFPVGSDAFVTRLEKEVGRVLRPRMPGPECGK